MWNRITFENNHLSFQDRTNLFDCRKRNCSTNKQLFKNSPGTRSAVTEVSFPSSKVPTRFWTFSGCMAKCDCLCLWHDATLALPLLRRRRFSSLPRTFTPWVHSRLLRETRLSLTSNPKATHRHVPGKTLGPYIVLIRHVGFIDRSPLTFP